MNVELAECVALREGKQRGREGEGRQTRRVCTREDEDTNILEKLKED